MESRQQKIYLPQLWLTEDLFNLDLLIVLFTDEVTLCTYIPLKSALVMHIHTFNVVASLTAGFAIVIQATV
jgi:hypothetical protein